MMKGINKSEGVKLEINHKKDVKELDLGQTSIWEGNKNGG